MPKSPALHNHHRGGGLGRHCARHQYAGHSAEECDDAAQAKDWGHHGNSLVVLADLIDGMHCYADGYA